MTDLEQKAKSFAARAHAGQVRKYTGEPYINHPAAVVLTEGDKTLWAMASRLAGTES